MDVTRCHNVCWRALRRGTGQLAARSQVTLGIWRRRLCGGAHCLGELSNNCLAVRNTAHTVHTSRVCLCTHAHIQPHACSLAHPSARLTHSTHSCTHTHVNLCASNAHLCGRVNLTPCNCRLRLCWRMPPSWTARGRSARHGGSHVLTTKTTWTTLDLVLCWVRVPFPIDQPMWQRQACHHSFAQIAS
jgi:hypothetical protein